VVPPAPAPVPDGSVAARIYLIGDAGGPAAPFEPALRALRDDVSRAPDRSWVVYLGDNLYPRGMPDSAADDRAEAERRVAAQIDAVVGAGGSGFFIAGNHDWARGGAPGWERVLRQGQFIAAHSDGRMALLPDGGCPGPDVRDIGAHVRLVLIDTQWWLHNGPKPLEPVSACPAADSEGEVTDSLRMVLAGAGTRRVIVAGHHPMLSGGVHGGTFGFLEHVFPLRELNKALWIPFPVIGSLYPLARQGGITPQDLSGGRNREMRDSLSAAFAAGPPLVYAAGHDHDLQVHDGATVGAGYVIVSGAGTYGHESRVSWRETTLFAAEAPGYIRLDVTGQGTVRLSVVVVDKTGAGHEAFGTWLE